jgi:hypothetical protein
MISFYVCRKILWWSISFNPQGSALLMNQSFAFKYLCENFQPKLINSYINSQRLLDFLWGYLGSYVLSFKDVIQKVLFIFWYTFLSPIDVQTKLHTLQKIASTNQQQPNRIRGKLKNCLKNKSKSQSLNRIYLTLIRPNEIFLSFPIHFPIPFKLIKIKS